MSYQQRRLMRQSERLLGTIANGDIAELCDTYNQQQMTPAALVVPPEAHSEEYQEMFKGQLSESFPGSADLDAAREFVDAAYALGQLMRRPSRRARLSTLIGNYLNTIAKEAASHNSGILG